MTGAAFLVPFSLAFMACNADLAVAQNGLDGASAPQVDAPESNGEAGADENLPANAVDAEGGGAVARCEASAGLAPSADASACFIDLGQYDRSCSIDSDCVTTVQLSCALYQNSSPVPELYVRGGNFCDGCNCNSGTAINRNAVARYVADVSATSEGSGQSAFPICNCPPAPPSGTPLCVGGTCWPGPVDSGSGD